MRWSFNILTLFGIPIRIHLSMLVFLGLVTVWGGGWRGLLLTAAIFASVVIHELGHALVARRRGLSIADISLHPFGGMARMLDAPRTTRDEILVAAAGPAVSLGLALLFGVLGQVGSWRTLLDLAEVNALLAAFNLLPLLPMDGGRILRAWLARRVGYYKATRWAARLARALALGLGILGLVTSPWLTVLAFFLFLMTGAEENLAETRRYSGDPGYQDAPAEIMAPEWMRGGPSPPPLPSREEMHLARGPDGRLIIIVRPRGQ